MTFTLKDPGTPEHEWLDVIHRGTVAPLELDWSAFDTMVVVAAHPDDESLGAGGLICRARAHGVEIVVVLATRGEASHPRSVAFPAPDLAEIRITELGEAMRHLAPQALIDDVGLGDGHVTAHIGQLEDAVLARCWGNPGRVLVAAPWSGDGHCDHEAAGLAAQRAAEKAGCPLLEYPIWLWFWGAPGGGGTPWAAMRTLALSPKEITQKSLAMGEHRSQIEPLSDADGDETLLTEDVLQHFRRTFEVFIDTRGHFVPTNERHTSWIGARFDVIHAHGAEPWQAPTSWYERRKRQLTMGILPRDTFKAALELGCSTGVLTAELAGRCNSILGLDVSAEAVRTATARTKALPGAQIRNLRFPSEWPQGRFDLFVLSEVGYYLTAGQLTATVDAMCLSSLPGAVLAACHWRHPIDGWPLDGDAVHRLLRGDSRLDLLGSYSEEDFTLQTFTVKEQP
ncbi:PIG-L family deacetylase [Pseudarthrobacter sp. P1]|uniref:PIG-L family deacetylase n=1 Tax=Pseudarthrobacter sp. P1 TaxID=3418418 RepID=UPI003CF0B0FC